MGFAVNATKRIFIVSLHNGLNELRAIICNCRTRQNCIVSFLGLIKVLFFFFFSFSFFFFFFKYIKHTFKGQKLMFYSIKVKMLLGLCL